MKRTIFVQFAMAFAVAIIGNVPPASAQVPQYSRAEVKQMIQDAHTSQQYQALAAYYRARQHEYKEQARAEMREWERRIQFDWGPAEKYPRPVDSSRNRYEYFTYEANQMSQKAAHFEGLANSTQPASH
jgi:hypothetical protein